MICRAGCWVLLQFLSCCSSWFFLDSASVPQSCAPHIKPAVPSAREGSACVTSAGCVEWRGEDKETDKGLCEPGLKGQAETAAHLRAGWHLCTSPTALWEMSSWTVSSNPPPVKKERSQAREETCFSLPVHPCTVMPTLQAAERLSRAAGVNSTGPFTSPLANLLHNS